MDNCSADFNEDAIRILTGARVCVVTVAPHTTQVFQVLDFTLFAVLKRRPTYELPSDGDNATAKCIMKVSHDFRQTVI
jgi:hypothetical protein